MKNIISNGMPKAGRLEARDPTLMNPAMRGFMGTSNTASLSTFSIIYQLSHIIHGLWTSQNYT